jgi:hypothetical protein
MDLSHDRTLIRTLYVPGTKDFTLVNVPELTFAAVDSVGDPSSEKGAAAVKALFAAVLPIRREQKARMGKDFVEPPLEMVYWADDMADIAAKNRARWQWRAMIVLPGWVDEAVLSGAVAEAERQAGPLAAASRFVTTTEGRCAQIMHIGAPNGVAACLERLYATFLPDHKLVPRGAYHEIYLDDSDRVAADKRKIILRQPVAAH